MTGGTGTFNVTLKTAGPQTLTVTDTASSAIAGTSNSVLVNAGATAKFTVTANLTTVTAGSNVTFTVTAQDTFGNLTGSAYSGTVHFTTTDGQATLPANTTLFNGTGNFTVTLKTAGPQTLTATDTASSAIAGTSNSVSVNAAATAKFVVAGSPTSVTAGNNVTFTVTAQDTFGNLTGAGYTGTVHFTSTDGLATPPANTTLTNGTGTFNVTLKTAGPQTLTATDTASSAIAGTSNSVLVNAAATAKFAVTAPDDRHCGQQRQLHGDGSGHLRQSHRFRL